MPAKPTSPGEPANAGSAPPKARLAAIDRMRGLVIVLMALDHTRDFFSAARFSPTDLGKTTPALFLTRWITHYCAPAFIFLAGTSAYLYGQKHPGPALRRFLLTRGLWLVLLEFTVVNFVWTFNFDYHFGVVMQVIWATGISMCLLAALTVLPAWAVGAFGAFMIVGHDLLDEVTPERFGAWAPLWTVLHVDGPVPFGRVIYPLIPWVGVMAAGYAFGRVYELEPARRRSLLLSLGADLCGAFVLVRLLNAYGDPSPWSHQPVVWRTVLSFVNVSKYPPSLAYVLMTLGPTLLVLALFERVHGRLPDALETFGRVPLFAYVVHLGLVHLLAGLLALALGYGSGVLTNMFMSYPPNWGFGLLGVYGAWLVVLALLFGACRWFASVKRRRRDWWLAYL